MSTPLRRLGIPENRVVKLPWWRRWRAIFGQFWIQFLRDNVSMMAAGVAFYGLLAIFPAMSALISIFGLVANPSALANEINQLYGVLPSEVVRLLSTQLHALAAAPRARLGLSLVVSLAVALWSAINGTGMLMQTLTLAYNERDSRSLLKFYLVALGLTIVLSLLVVSILFLVAIVPVIVDLLPMPAGLLAHIALIRWPIVVVLIALGLSILYRFAPCRGTPHWHLLSSGTIGAVVLWLLGSAGFSFYVSYFGSYDKTYGSLGAVIVLLMWFYLSAYIILAGAELNAVIEARGPRHRRSGV